MIYISHNQHLKYCGPNLCMLDILDNLTSKINFSNKEEWNNRTTILNLLPIGTKQYISWRKVYFEFVQSVFYKLNFFLNVMLLRLKIMWQKLISTSVKIKAGIFFGAIVRRWKGWQKKRNKKEFNSSWNFSSFFLPM